MRRQTKFRFRDLDSPLATILRFGHARPAKVRYTYVQPGQGRIRGAPAWLSHSCRIVHAEARALVHRTRWPLQLRGARGQLHGSTKRRSLVHPRPYSACIPRASTRETALERSAECNAQCRANTRRHDANSCGQDPLHRHDYANFRRFYYSLSLLDILFPLGFLNSSSEFKKIRFI